MTTENIPYTGRKERKLMQRDPLLSKFNHELKVYLSGIGESGKTSLFKQICYANGYYFGDEEKKTLRYHLIKTVFIGIKSMFHYCDKENLPIMVEFAKDVKIVRKFMSKYIVEEQDLRKAQKLVISREVKDAVVRLWKSPGFHGQFRRVMQTGDYKLIESCKMILDRLSTDESLLAAFGTKGYLPDDDMCMLSNGGKYPQEQNCYFACEKNSSLKGINKQIDTGATEAGYFARPDVRPTVLKAPLKHANPRGITGRNCWKICFSEPKQKFPKTLRDRDCLVFTADLSSYDIPVGPGVGQQKVDGRRAHSVLYHSLQEFKKAVQKGHLIALVLTHLDVFIQKYRIENLPLNHLGDFTMAPIIEDEDHNSVSIALRYFRKLFSDARLESLDEMEGNIGQERKLELFRVFCIDGTDPDNVQGTLRALLEQYFGLNVPSTIKSLD